MTQFFILLDEERRNNAIESIKRMNINGRKLSVEIKEYRKNRTNSQNRLYWSWINLFSQHTGYSSDEMHEQFAVQFLGIEDRIVKGEKLRMAKSTARLKVEEFSQYMLKIELVAEEMGLSLPRPDDYRYALTGKESAAEV